MQDYNLSITVLLAGSNAKGPGYQKDCKSIWEDILTAKEERK